MSVSFSRPHSEQSSNGTNNTSNAEAAKSKARGTTAATCAARGGGGSRGFGRAAEELVRTITLYQSRKDLPSRCGRGVARRGVCGGGATVCVRRGADVAATAGETAVVGTGLDGDDISVGSCTGVILEGDVASRGRN